MEYLKAVESFDISLDECYITKTLPVKWSCTVYLENVVAAYASDQFAIRYTYLGVDPNIDSSKCTTTTSYAHYKLDNSLGNVVCTTLVQQMPCRFNKFTGTMNVDNNSLNRKTYADVKLRVNIVTFVPRSTANIPRNITPLLGLNIRDPATPHDYILNIGEDKFYVKKSILSFYSSYFDKMFDWELLDDNQDETVNKLEDLESEEFGNFLQFLYPGTTNVTEDNVSYLWKLADRFGVPCVTKMCEEFVCGLGVDDATQLKLSDRMEIAEQYKSPKLTAALVDIMKNMKL